MKRFNSLSKRVGAKHTDLKQGETKSIDDYTHRALSFNCKNNISEDYLVSITEQLFREKLAHIIMPHRSHKMEELREIGTVAELTVSVTA